MFTGLSRDYPGTVPGLSRPFPEIFLGILFMCFPFSPGKGETHKQFDPHPISGTIPRSCLCLLVFFSPECYPCQGLGIFRQGKWLLENPPRLRERSWNFSCETWRQIWRVTGRESGSPELLGSPRTSPEVPRTSPEVFRRLPRKFSHCGT